MVAVRIPTIGEILISLATTIYADGFFYITGHDEDHNDYILKCSRISVQNDLSREYGWASIVGYWTSETFIPCQCYSSIS